MLGEIKSTCEDMHGALHRTLGKHSVIYLGLSGRYPSVFTPLEQKILSVNGRDLCANEAQGMIVSCGVAE